MRNFVNCDYFVTAYGTRPDVACDLRQLPFKSNSVDEIHAIHVWEHFERVFEIPAVLREWRRVLCIRGFLALEMPCWDLIVEGMRRNGVDRPFYMRGIYGEDYDHKWCWSIAEIFEFLEAHGMMNVQRAHPRFHYATRDMRIECYA